MPTIPEGQEIPLASTNAYDICDSGERYTFAVRLNSGVQHRVWFSRDMGDEAGTLRCKSNFGSDFIMLPVAQNTQVPGIPVDVTTTGDMITGTITFTEHPEP